MAQFFAYATLLLVLTCNSAPLKDDLPEELKKEKARIEQKLKDIEARLPKSEPESIEQSLKEAKLMLDEFTLNAELTKEDPVYLKLKSKMDALLEDSKKIELKKPSPKMDNAPSKMTKKRVDPASLVEIPVDLKNVSFKRDVAPILVNACLRCHNPNMKSGEFDTSTFAKFAEQLTPGKPDDSHVLDLVTGKAQPRMPRGGQAVFSKKWVDIWTAWIKQGAKFDGPSKTAALTTYMVDLEQQRRELFANMSDSELQKIHQSHSERQIAIVNPKNLSTKTTDNFYIYSTLNEQDTEYAATLAEAVIEDLDKKFHNPKSKSKLFRGKFGLNLFADRYDFLAFARSIDNRQPEADEFGYTNILLDHQYVALTIAQSGWDLDSVVADQVAEAYLTQLGNRKLPAWVIHGYARLVASQYGNRATGPKQDVTTAAEKAASGKNLTGLFKEQYPWGDQAPIATSFFQFLQRADKKRMDEFVLSLSKSGNLQEAITSNLKASQEDLSRNWQGWIVGQSRSKRGSK